MSTPKNIPQKTPTCPECGGTDIAMSIGISQDDRSGTIGLPHNTEYFVKATEPLVVDVPQLRDGGSTGT